MHPIIRLSLFLTFTLGLTLSRELSYILPWSLPLLLLYRRYLDAAALAQPLWRLRWLFLSLLVFSLFFPPAGDMSAGLKFGLTHVLILALVVLAARLLLALSSLEELIAALDWLLSPLRLLGIPTTRFSLRLVLVLDTVQAMRQVYKGLADNREPSPRGRLDYLSQQATRLFLHAAHQGETCPLQELELPRTQAPPFRQWLYPGGLLLLFVWFHQDFFQGLF